MGTAYQTEVTKDIFDPAEKGRFAWSAYFSNVVTAAQASTAAQAGSDRLTEANMQQVMTVSDTGAEIVAGEDAPLLAINGREYNPATDTIRYIGRWLVGCHPAPGITGSGYGVGVYRGSLARINEAKRMIAMYSAEGAVFPSALTALTYRAKGVPQEVILTELVDGFASNGVGVTIANLADLPDRWLGVASCEVDAAGELCTVTFSRPYAHPPVVCLGDGDTAATIIDVTSETVILRLHSPILERRVFKSIIAIGFIA